MEQTVYTIGYEGSDLADFLATLKNAGVKVLLDVRALPVSRRKGFSKNPMSQALTETGIEYVHLKGLGNPQKLGTAPTGNFHESFTTHMKSDEAQIDLKKAVEIATEKPACLLCYERNHNECHRDIVVDYLTKRTKQNINHLVIDKGGAVQLGLAV